MLVGGGGRFEVFYCVWKKLLVGTLRKFIDPYFSGMRVWKLVSIIYFSYILRSAYEEVCYLFDSFPIFWEWVSDI